MAEFYNWEEDFHSVLHHSEVKDEPVKDDFGDMLNTVYGEGFIPKDFVTVAALNALTNPAADLSITEAYRKLQEDLGTTCTDKFPTHKAFGDAICEQAELGLYLATVPDFIPGRKGILTTDDIIRRLVRRCSLSDPRPKKLFNLALASMQKPNETPFETSQYGAMLEAQITHSLPDDLLKHTQMSFMPEGTRTVFGQVVISCLNQALPQKQSVQVTTGMITRAMIKFVNNEY